CTSFILFMSSFIGFIANRALGEVALYMDI
ncbi:MAG: hypothetical protein ACI8SZ_001480, partial [Colwellia sp.]